MSERPNILLITTDQQRFDTYGPGKPSFLRTPHLDALARDGLRYTHAYADCPICAPGRAALMTGRSCYDHGMGTNAPSCDHVSDEHSLPTLLHAQGYQTCGIGKLHFHPQRTRHGFDQTVTLDAYYREMARSGSPLQPRRHGLGENELVATMATVPEAQTLTSWTTERAVDWLLHERDPRSPFFLWVSYTKPHAPLDPPEPYYSMYRDSPIPEPWTNEWMDVDAPYLFEQRRLAHCIDTLDAEQIRAARAAYYGLISQIDFNIGRLMAALQDTGCFFSPNDDTLIAFASDHGDHLGDHGITAKSDPLEGSWHVPMALRLPRTWPSQRRHQGAERDEAVCLQDLSATILAAAGAAVPDDWYGQDLIAVADGRRAARPWVLGGAGFNHRRPNGAWWSGITDGRWKYVWHYDGGQAQLFDLDGDPQERHDLAGEPAHAQREAALRAELIAQLREHAPQYLDGDDLIQRPRPELDRAATRASAFPGHMRDDHASDALH